MGAVEIADFSELKQRIAARHDTAEKKKDLALNIYGTDEVHWKYVVMAFDAAIGAGVQKVQFGVGKENEGIQIQKR
jgi:biopolymer transport protein ExbD